MAAKSVTSEALSRAFITTLLFTGSVSQSEAALLEGIQDLDLDDDASGELLIRTALQAAIERQGKAAEQQPEEVEYALTLVPPELRRVLRLPADLRHSFLLRILGGLPSDVCASLLHLEIRQVDEAAGDAAQMLARISAEEDKGQAASK